MPERNDMVGSSARQHEQSGGNVQPGERRLPQAGEAARASEQEERSERQAVRAAGAAIRLPAVRGANLAGERQVVDPQPRKASDYLPAELKARLIAEGKLTPEGDPVVAPKRSVLESEGQPGPAVEISDKKRPDGASSRAFYARIGEFIQKLFR